MLINIVIYIDDTLIVAINRQILVSQTHKVVDIFQKCGFLVNFKKSQLIPTQQIEFLGFIIDSVQFTISLTQKKRSDLLRIVNAVLANPSRAITIRFLAKIIGKNCGNIPSIGSCSPPLLQFRQTQN